jgi:hypothetical protein
VRFPCVHAVATTPAQRLSVLLRSLHSVVSAFPDMAVGSACALSFSRLARRSLALRPAHSRCHRISWLAIRRLQPLRYLHSCSGCFRLERLPGGPCTHWKAPPFHGARHFRTHAPQQRVQLFDHLVGADQNGIRDRQAQQLCRPGIDDQFMGGGLLDGNVSGLGTL